MTRDARALTDQVEHFDPPTADQTHKARLIVCANSIDSVDAIDLLMMLGIHPSQEEDFILPPPASVH